jgi:Acyl-CoA dehydrogenase, C-terminal domain/Acyl-CoA dehydrogenase, N-terminal domain
MTGGGRILPSGDDSALPDAERALLERARALVPLLAERASAATAARQLPAETIAEYHAAGILRILQPKRFGGMQGRFSLFSRIVEELTYGCASSAWVYAVLAEHQWIIAQYPEAAQIDVWGEDPLAVAASSLAPREAARRVPGGWRLSGHYPFSSGCDYCMMCSFPSIARSWSATSLPAPHRGRWSIPIIRCCARHAGFWCPSHCRRSPSRSAAALSTSPVLRSPPGCRAGVTRVAESEIVQMVIGEAAAAIDVATLLLHTGRDYSTAEVSSGRRITEAEALRARRDMVYAQHQVGWALDRLCELDGARWVYDSDELGAIRRDVMTILAHHAASRQAAMAPYGKMLLSRAG